MLLQPHPAALKSDAFGFKPQSLFQARFAWQKDLAARPEYAVPRQTTRVSQRPNYLSRTAGEARGSRHIAIS